MTHIRVGNEEYAKENKSYGLTTMRHKHVEVHGSDVTFSFQGKSRVHHTISLHDKRLARIIKQCSFLECILLSRGARTPLCSSCQQR